MIELAGREAEPARLRRLGRGLARGRDRDRRLAARRAVRPPGRPDRRRGRQLEGLRPLGAELRPPRRPRRLRRAPRALRRPPRRRRADDPRPTSSRRSPRRSPPTPTGSCSTRIWRPSPASTRSCPRRALTLELARELEQLSPFGLGNPDVTLLVAGCEAVGASTVGEGKHLRFRVRQHGRDAGSAIAFGLGGQLERLQGASRFDVAFRLKQNRWNGTVAPQLVVRRVFDTAAAYEELRLWLAELWRAGRDQLDARGAARLRRARASRVQPASGSCSSHRRSGCCSSTARRSRCRRRRRG